MRLQPAEHAADVHQLNIGSAIAFAVAVVLSVALGWFIAGRLLRPLQTISATARDISAHNLHRRLDLTGPENELKELGETLDNLFGRLEASFESERHFAANASHELRTPLTAERSLLQVALADPDADAETLRATCEEVLRLGICRNPSSTRSSPWPAVKQESSGGSPWTSERWPVRSWSLEAKTHSSEASMWRRILLQLALRGDSALVEILIANLVDNALRHNLAGGRIHVFTFVKDASSYPFREQYGSSYLAD